MSEALFRGLHLSGVTGKSRVEQYQGREYLVVPVIALMEGVIHAVNASSAEFVPMSALSMAPAGWDGRPLMMGHPAKDGVQISANSTSVLESQSFGLVFNTRLEGKKLLMDAYIDPVKTLEIGGEKMLERLRNNETMEVSVGAFVTTSAGDGEHNGKPYKATWNTIVPDHLAFLPNGRGACSVAMGCGTHRAAEEGVDVEIYDLNGDEPTVLGGSGSGNFRHSGRKGEVGGSGDSGNTERGMGDSRTPKGGGEKVAEKVATHGTPDSVKTAYSTTSRDPMSYSGKPPTDVHANNVHIGSVHPQGGGAYSIQHQGNWVNDKVYGKKEAIDKLKAVHQSPKPEKFYQKGKIRGAQNMDVLSTLEGESLDERIAKVNSAVMEHWARPMDMPMSMPSNPSPWVKTVYDDRAIVSIGDKMYSVSYTTDAEGDVELGTPVEVKLSYVAAAAEDCPMCKGAGNVDGNPCEACAGSGEMKAAIEAAVEPEVKAEATPPIQKTLDLPIKSAACGCGGHTMTLEQKAELVKQLVADKHSGFTAEDEAMLATASDTRLESFRVAAEARAKEVKAAQEAAAPRTLTEEEFMKVAPSELKDLISRTKAADTSRKADLVAGLKAAQDEYTESELSAMPLETLERMGRVAKLVEEKPNYEGRAIPRSASSKMDVHANPPDPYAPGLAAMRAARVN